MRVFYDYDGSDFLMALQSHHILQSVYIRILYYNQIAIINDPLPPLP